MARPQTSAPPKGYWLKDAQTLFFLLKLNTLLSRMKHQKASHAQLIPGYPRPRRPRQPAVSGLPGLGP